MKSGYYWRNGRLWRCTIIEQVGDWVRVMVKAWGREVRVHGSYVYVQATRYERAAGGVKP